MIFSLGKPKSDPNVEFFVAEAFLPDIRFRCRSDRPLVISRLLVGIQRIGTIAIKRSSVSRGVGHG